MYFSSKKLEREFLEVSMETTPLGWVLRKTGKQREGRYSRVWAIRSRTGCCLLWEMICS